MNKMKYLAAILIAVAGLGLQQAQAHLLDPQTFFLDQPLMGGQAERDYLVNNGYIDASCQFATKWEAGTGFEDPSNPFNQYFTITETAGDTWHITWDLTGSGFELCGVLIKDGAIDQQQLYRFYGVSADELLVGEGDVSFADLGRDISHISFFVRPAGGVPDGGTTVMLLGAALGSLGMARRFLKR
jgi:hypothetical protein